MNLLPVFLVGLVGSVHCVGMCGGIVGALSSAAPSRVIAIRPLAAMSNDFPRVLFYNLGRLSSYAAAGALAGGIAAGLLRGADVLGWLMPAQRLAYVAANLVLALLGLYLTQWWSALAQIERLGQGLWALVRPLAARFLPVDTPMKALALGGLWGWLPCGMVYGALLTALMAGSAAQGALTMLAFGTGTLPMLLAAGLSGARLRQLAARPGWRRAAGLVVLAFGVLGLLRAAGLGGMGIAHGWIDAFCVGPVHGARP